MNKQNFSTLININKPPYYDMFESYFVFLGYCTRPTIEP